MDRVIFGGLNHHMTSSLLEFAAEELWASHPKAPILIRIAQNSYDDIYHSTFCVVPEDDDAEIASMKR